MKRKDRTMKNFQVNSKEEEKNQGFAIYITCSAEQ